jgi:hypothetical protein
MIYLDIFRQYIHGSQMSERIISRISVDRLHTKALSLVFGVYEDDPALVMVVKSTIPSALVAIKYPNLRYVRHLRAVFIDVR